MDVSDPSASAEFRALLDFYFSLISTDVSSQRGFACPSVVPVASLDLVVALLRHATELFRHEPNVLSIPCPVNVIGDLHGNLFDLLRYLRELGTPPSSSFLFLGDIVDRGFFSTETVILILLLKVLYPSHIWLIRGNHEFDEPCVAHPDFYEELSALYECDIVRIRFLRLFSYVPIAATINNSVFAVHAGFPHDLASLAQLEELRRPISTFDDPLLNDLIWSDPDDQLLGVRPSPRGFGHLFGRDVTAAFLERTGLSAIVRGHQWIRSGVRYAHQNRVVTVFSASSTMSETHGGVLVVRKGGKLDDLTFAPLPPITRSEVTFVHLDTARHSTSLLPKISPAISAGATLLRPWDSCGNLKIKQGDMGTMPVLARGEKLQRNTSVRAAVRKWSVPRVPTWMRAAPH